LERAIVFQPGQYKAQEKRHDGASAKAGKDCPARCTERESSL